MTMFNQTTANPDDFRYPLTTGNITYYPWQYNFNKNPDDKRKIRILEDYIDRLKYFIEDLGVTVEDSDKYDLIVGIFESLLKDDNVD